VIKNSFTEAKSTRVPANFKRFKKRNFVARLKKNGSLKVKISVFSSGTISG